MSGAALQLLCLSGAFWVAVLLYRRGDPEGDHGPRFVTGLALGAALSHLGWAALYLDRVWAEPRALFAPAGFCVLFVPLGLLAATPWRAPRAPRMRFLAAAFASLPLALATARIGCLFAGCCGGLPTDLPWGLRLGSDTIPRHPTALYDILGLLVLHACTRRLPAAHVAPGVLAGLGFLRLAIDPLRISPPLGPPLASPAWIAATWVLLGLVLDRSAAGGR